VLIAAAIGGTAEKLGGGKFANGAVTGAYVMMFYHMMHEWHPTREAAYSSAEANTITTGNETAVLGFVDRDGAERYWECPAHPDNGPLKVKWVWPSDNDLEGLTLVEEFHFSPGVTSDGRLVKTSVNDYKNSQKHKITVTHISVGVGMWVWVYDPISWFPQPHGIVFERRFSEWNMRNPVKHW